jgi:hypothetical protein
MADSRRTSVGCQFSAQKATTSTAGLAPLIREASMGKWKHRQGAPSLDKVAGNGLINRRVLLGSGLTIAGALGAAGTMTTAAAEPLSDAAWSLAVGQSTPPVQTLSPFEKDVTRALSNPHGEFRTSHARTPHHRLGGTVTPNGLHFSINHGGIPNIDPAEHSLSSMAWCAGRLNSRPKRTSRRVEILVRASSFLGPRQGVSLHLSQ